MYPVYTLIHKALYLIKNKNQTIMSDQYSIILFPILVRITGIEPARVSSQDSKSCVSTSSTISAYHSICTYIYTILRIYRYG